MVGRAAGFRREALMESRPTAARTLSFDAHSDQQRDTDGIGRRDILMAKRIAATDC
jgi:hypothetical protein